MDDPTPAASATPPSLLLRLRDPRDQESWRTFTATYAPLVYRHARRQGLQDADAADVTQEVLAQVARSIRGFVYDPAKGRFRDWLFTVTRHKVGRHRQRWERGRAAGDGDETFPELAVEADAQWCADFNAHLLQSALDRVKPRFEPKTWDAFAASWLENKPAPDVAAALGLPIEAVYVARSRVLKRLRDEILHLAEDVPQFAQAE